jgi:undecaprenyl diphosphate synthase
MRVKNGELSVDDIDDSVVSDNLTTAGIPDPELLIRTSGELRLSNYLLWQLAYTELYFTDTLWPDFREESLYEAIIDYQKRERRFGKTSEQLV